MGQQSNRDVVLILNLSRVEQRHQTKAHSAAAVEPSADRNKTPANFRGLQHHVPRVLAGILPIILDIVPAAPDSILAEY